VIVQVNRHDVDSANQAVATVHATPAGQDLLLLVWSKGGEGYRVIHPDLG
jgi:serine protease Do